MTSFKMTKTITKMVENGNGHIFVMVGELKRQKQQRNRVWWRWEGM